MFMEGFIFGMFSFLITGAQCEVSEVLTEVGSQAVLPCKCIPLLCSTAAIIWSKDNQGTLWRKERSGLQYWGSSWMGKEGARVQCPHDQLDKGDCNLQINRVTESDGGLYTCRVLYGHQYAVTQVFLRVVQVSIVPSAPVWGRGVSITCRVNPWPTEGSVRWMLNNHEYKWKNRISSNKEQSVVKEVVTEKVVGNWTCVVNSKKEWQYSIPLSVIAIIKPPKDDTMVYAALGSAVTLPCVFSPELNPEDTAWEKVGFGNLDLNRPSLSSWDQSATINEVEFKDQGKYRCAGSINGKRLTRTMQLVVAKIIQENRKGFVMLTCQLTDTSQDTEYEWVPAKYDLNGTRTLGQIQKGQGFVMEENWDEVTCRYYGKQGLLGNVTHHNQVMIAGAQSKENSKERWHNTGTVIVLSFLLVILLLVLAQMFRNFQRKKRIFQYPALETIVHTISNEREERERRTQAKKDTRFQEEIQ